MTQQKLRERIAKLRRKKHKAWCRGKVWLVNELAKAIGVLERQDTKNFHIPKEARSEQT